MSDSFHDQSDPEVPAEVIPGAEVRSLDPGDRGAVRREVMRLAWPVVLQQCFRTMIMYVDTIMIGHYDPEGDAMAAMGIVGPLTYTVISIMMALGIGTIATVARATGEGDRDKQERDAAASLVIAVGLGVVLSVLGFFFMPEAARFFSVPGAPGVAEMASGYLVFLGWSLIFHLLDNSASSTLRAAGDTKTPMIIAILCNLLNIALNYVLIFGHLGFPSMGVTGAGIATAISFGLQGTLTTLWLFSPWSRLRLRLSSCRKVTRESVRRLVKVTIPAAVEPVVFQAGFLVYIKVITLLGTASLAAHRAAIMIESVSFMPGYGFSIACSALVGQALGARKPEVAQVGFQESARVSTYVMTVMGVVFLLAGTQLMRLFVPGNESIVAMGALVLAIAAFEQPFLALTMVYGGALRGAGDTRSPVVVAILGVWLVRVPLAYVMAFPLGLGLTGIWVTMVVDWLVRAAVYAWIWGRGRWKTIEL